MREKFTPVADAMEAGRILRLLIGVIVVFAAVAAIALLGK